MWEKRDKELCKGYTEQKLSNLIGSRRAARWYRQHTDAAAHRQELRQAMRELRQAMRDLEGLIVELDSLHSSDPSSHCPAPAAGNRSSNPPSPGRHPQAAPAHRFVCGGKSGAKILMQVCAGRLKITDGEGLKGSSMHVKVGRGTNRSDCGTDFRTSQRIRK